MFIFESTPTLLKHRLKFRMEESKTFLNYRHQSVTANQSNPNFLNFELSTLCRVKISPTDGPKQLLLSLGCGPSLHVVACISSQFDEIFMAETDEGYRRELKSWVDRHAGAFNWDPMLSQVASLKQITGKETNADQLFSRLLDFLFIN